MQQYCSKCNVYTKQQYCPLCTDKLSETSEENAYYPVYETNNQERRFAQRLVLFIVTIVVSISLLINLLTEPQHLWLLYFFGASMYGFLFLLFTMLFITHKSYQYIYQFISIM